MIAEIDREMANSSRPGGVLQAWTDLVAALALGPEPEVRECPTCGHLAMRAASRCSNCWSKLTPLP